jgi:hypothetical protein
MSQAYPNLSYSKLTIHCTPGGCITVICFDQWAEVYASRMMMQLAPVSASALSRCSSFLTLRFANHYQLSV